MFKAHACGEEKQRVQHDPSNTHGDTARAVYQSHLLRPRLRVAWGWVRGGTGGVAVHWVMGNRNPPLTALPLAAAVGTCKCTACWQPIAGCRPSAVDQRPWRLAAAHSKLSWGAVGESSYTLTAPTRPMKDVGQSRFAVLALRKVGTHAKVGALRCLRRVRVQGRGLQGGQTWHVAAVTLA